MVWFWSFNRLDVYIYDYLVKRKLHSSAKAFQAEARVSADPAGKTFWTFAKENKFNVYYGFQLVSFYTVRCLMVFRVYMYFSNWCTWWLSLWMVVRLLGRIYCQDKWEALRGSCIIHWGGFTVFFNQPFNFVFLLSGGGGCDCESFWHSASNPLFSYPLYLARDIIISVWKKSRRSLLLINSF